MIKRILFYLFLVSLMLASSCINREKEHGFTDAKYYIPELDLYIAYSFKEDEHVYRKLHVMISKDATFDDINEIDHLVFDHSGDWNTGAGFYISKYSNEIYLYKMEAVVNSKYFTFKDVRKYPEFENTYNTFYTPPCYYINVFAQYGRAKLKYYPLNEGDCYEHYEDEILPDATLKRCDTLKPEGRIEYKDLDGNKLYYEVLSKEKNTVALVYDPTYKKAKEIDVPSEIVYNDTAYTVTEIDECAFIYCDSLERITLPDSLETIREWAFYSCSSLKDINIPHGVKKVENHVFSKCLSLSSAKLSSKTSAIGEKSFYKCISLRSIKFPNTLDSIGKGAFFSCSSLKSLYIPRSVNYLGSYVFLKCNNLKRVKFQNHIENQSKGEQKAASTLQNDRLLKLCEFAFYDCEKLESILLPNSLKYIEDFCFRHCSSLKYVKLPDSLRVIGAFVFGDCSSLKKIVLPSNIRQINSCVFSNGSNLRTVIVESNTPPEIDVHTFYDRHDTHDYIVSLIENRFIIYVPNNSLEAYRNQEYWGEMDIKPMSELGD